MTRRILHLSSQRPSLTGSGVTLDALVRHAARAGWEQHVSTGVPVDDPRPEVGGLDASRIHPLLFGRGGDLPFPVPGMSDVMPYRSTVWSTMDDGQLAAYRQAFCSHLQRVIERARPHVIHSHHVWLMSGMLKDIAPEIPVVVQCHATGLRQMELCPHLAEEARVGNARNDHFAVLQGGHERQLVSVLGVEPARVHRIGAGYREELFHARDREAGPERVLYIGKYAAAKGVPQLLDAMERLRRIRPGLELHMAGTGSGEEADAIRRRLQAMGPWVTLHGQVPQPRLAELMRGAAVCVLPSFYEGLPLVLVEAMACGCRLVSTALPGVVDELAPHLGEALELVPMPAMAGVDTPVEGDLPVFVEALAHGLDRSLGRPPLDTTTMTAALERFTWGAVFRRAERIW